MVKLSVFSPKRHYVIGLFLFFVAALLACPVLSKFDEEFDNNNVHIIATM